MAAGKAYAPIRRVAPAGSARRVARSTGYILSCAVSSVLLVVSGLTYFGMRDLSVIGGSHAIASGRSVGEQNILLMGLESRTDWNGNVLPQSILTHLHSGNYNAVKYGNVGGNATNTLILIHIPNGGGHAEAVSIPRDDLVDFAGMAAGAQSRGKIDTAYSASMAATESALRSSSPSMSQNDVAFAGNEAGRKATVATVEQLTGVHIDHFAEVNLFGFYELAKVFGGINVCLRNPVPLDPYSGFFAPKAGLRHLGPELALAFVRQRHGLLNGDLDRTHRQQAFIDAVVYKLLHDGVLSDLSKIQSLITVAQRYAVTDSGWNLIDFVSEAKNLLGKNMTFRTAPITGYSNDPVYGSVNTIDPLAVKAMVHEFFWPPAKAKAPAKGKGHSVTTAPAPSSVVDVLNGGYTAHLAANVSAKLVQAGYKPGQVAGTAYRSTTSVRYGPGSAADAKRIAALFGVTAEASSALAAGHVEVLLGSSATIPEIPGTGTTPAPTSSASASTAVTDTGPSGGAVTVGLGSNIPCVN